MKIILAIKYIFLSLIISVIGLQTVSAQEDNYGWRIGAEIGYMDYYGDISPYHIGKRKDWNKVFRFFQYNKNYIPEASYGITLERKLTPTTGLVFQVDHGQFSMSDRYRKTNGVEDPYAPHWYRALNFETTVWDFGAAVLLRSDNGRLLPLNAFIAPYLSFGAGVTKFKIKGDLYTVNGDRYNYGDPLVSPDNIYETNLRSLRTETDNEYPDIVAYTNMNIGFKIRLSSRINLAVQTDIKYSFSDHLDDVKGKYKENYESSQQAYGAHPGTNLIDPVTKNRGNNDGINDIFIFNKIAFQYNFGHKRLHHFTAPIIYEPGRVFYEVIQDTAAHRTADLTYRIDSLGTSAFIDSSKTQMETTTPSMIESQYDTLKYDLHELKSELRSLRFSHLDQDYIIRLNTVQNEMKAIKTARGNLLQEKPQTKEGKLQVRLYDLQLDSLDDIAQSIQYAREQLRMEMSNSPIITEYKDSTKIMIYKIPSNYENTHPRPLINGQEGVIRTDTIAIDRVNRERNITDKISTQGTRSVTYGRSVSATDSLRQELATLRQSPRALNDPIYSYQLDQIEQRLDSLNGEVNLDPSSTAKTQSNSRFNKNTITDDSLQLIYLSEKTDSLRALVTLKRRSGIQRLFDKFNKKRNPTDINTIAQSRNQEDSLYIFKDTIETFPAEKKNRIQKFLDGFKPKVNRGRENQGNRSDSLKSYLQGNEPNGAYPTYDTSNYHASYIDQYPVEHLNNVISNNNQEIKSLQNDIIQLRKESELNANNRAPIIYESNTNNREARRSRQALNELSRDLRRSNRRDRVSPTITPNIVLSGQGSTDRKELQDIRNQLKTIHQQMEVKGDSEVISLQNQLDSMRNQQDTLTMTKVSNADSHPLQLKIDSLNAQLYRLQQEQADTLKLHPTPQEFNLSSFPVVSTYFVTGSSQLTSTEISKIRPIAEMAKKYPNIYIVINGYTDGTGNARINQILSEKRCSSVRDILINTYGIDSKRLRTKSNTPSGDDRNNPLQRRVDLLFEE